ncbi:hypothetical protein DFH07DRAFT_778555 [Mycena maculata]|uniref:Uncharacterized protein n=1 Tax=Mycena maculata TaxID=230809 RepID=A0AAD7IEM0_9AGAR|nr:hypothetical protein DFH07DRAFT_778555 [Mycena maculata]
MSQYTNKFYKDYPRYINSVRSLRNERARKENGPRKPGTRGWAGGVGRVGMGARGMHRGDGCAGREGACRQRAVVRWWARASEKEDQGGRVLPFVLVHARDLARARSLPCGLGYAANVRLLEMGTRGWMLDAWGWPHGVWRTGLAPRGLAREVGRRGFGVRGWPRGLWRVRLAAGHWMRGDGRTGFGARGWPRGVGRAGLAAELGVRAGMGVSAKEDAGDLARARSWACGYAANVPLLVKELSGHGNKKTRKNLTSTSNRAASSGDAALGAGLGRAAMAPRGYRAGIYAWGCPRGDWRAGFAPRGLAYGDTRVGTGARGWHGGDTHAGICPRGWACGDLRTGRPARRWHREDARGVGRAGTCVWGRPSGHLRVGLGTRGLAYGDARAGICAWGFPRGGSTARMPVRGLVHGDWHAGVAMCGWAYGDATGGRALPPASNELPLKEKSAGPKKKKKKLASKDAGKTKPPTANNSQPEGEVSTKAEKKKHSPKRKGTGPSAAVVNGTRMSPRGVGRGDSVDTA